MDRRRNVRLLEKKQPGRKSSGIPSILDAARNNNIEQIHTALRNGQDINLQDETGSSSLHHAAMFNLYDVISYLIFIGADPEIKNKVQEGQTVVDLCRDADMKDFLKQARRLTEREDYGKFVEDVALVTNDIDDVTFKSNYVKVTCPSLEEDETLTLRCRSVRLEEVSWRYLETAETACSDVYIVSTNRVKSVEDIELEIPLYNLPKPSEEIIIKTNANVAVTGVISYDRKRVSFCKFTLQLPPVLSLVAVCRHKTEVFEVATDTTMLVSAVDKDITIGIPDNSVVTSGRLLLQVYNSTEYTQLFDKVGGMASTSIIKLDTNDIDLSDGCLTLTIPLSKPYTESEELQGYSLQTTGENNEVSPLKLKGDISDNPQSITVCPTANSIVVVMETNVISKNEAITREVTEAFKTILHRGTPLQFQIGSKQGRNEQKRCKVLVTCSLEEEVDKTVAFWERDGFHFQWCTDTYNATSGEAFAVTLSGTMVFSNGFGDEKLEFHPRKRNYLVFEAMTNDILSSVSVSNVDIRPCSSAKPTVTHSAPLKKNVYIRKTNTLEDIGYSREKSVIELDREISNVSEKKPKPKKKKKKQTVLKRMSQENAKNNNFGDEFDHADKENSNTSLQDDATLDELLRESTDDSHDKTTEVNNVLVKEKGDEKVNDTHKEDGDAKQKAITDISSKSPTTSLTSLDADEGVVMMKKSPVPTLLRRASTDLRSLKDDVSVTTSRPVTTRSILLENPAVICPVERTFFSDAYLSIILDDIGSNWLIIYILIGIPFDVIDIKLTELHGKSPLHQILLQLLQNWRDEHAFHVHKGVPNMLSALRKGGKWDLSVSVQRRLKIWHDQKELDIKEDPLYKWLDLAYADSDVFIPAEYPRPMSDPFLMMFAPEVHFSNHVTTSLAVSYEEFHEIQGSAVYTNDTFKVMKVLTVYRARKVNVLEMLEELIEMCDELNFKRATRIIIVSLKGWLKRSAPDNDHLKSAIDKLVTKLLERSTNKCNTPNSIFRQRMDVRSALRILRTPANTRSQREVRSEYGKPSTSK